MLDSTKIVVTASGVDGSASGNKTSGARLRGKLIGFYIDVGSQPNTTDVTITLPTAPTATLLTVTNIAASGWYFPRYILHSEAAAALTGTSGGDRGQHPIMDYVKVAVAQGNAGDLTVWVFVER